MEPIPGGRTPDASAPTADPFVPRGLMNSDAAAGYGDGEFVVERQIEPPGLGRRVGEDLVAS